MDSGEEEKSSASKSECVDDRVGARKESKDETKEESKVDSKADGGSRGSGRRDRKDRKRNGRNGGSSAPSGNRDDGGKNEKKSFLRSVLEVLRDIAIAALIVGIVMGILYAYSGVWPPPVVVESQSMSHNPEGQDLGLPPSQVGVIDGGDMVIVKKVGSASEVIPYIQAQKTNYQSYGSYGDVIIYRSPSDVRYDATPIIHRAVLWAQYNRTATYLFSIGENNTSYMSYTNIEPALSAAFSSHGQAISGARIEMREADRWAITQYDRNDRFGIYEYEVKNTGSELRVSLVKNSYDVPEYNLRGLTSTYTLQGYGYTSEAVTIRFDYMLGYFRSVYKEPHSGFVTMGDHNVPTYDQYASPSNPGDINTNYNRGICSEPVKADWIIGVARGELPWFGGLKLWLSGNTHGVPENSWWYLGFSIALIIIIPLVLDFIIEYIRKRRKRNRDDGSGGGKKGDDRNAKGEAGDRDRDRDGRGDDEEGNEEKPDKGNTPVNETGKTDILLGKKSGDGAKKDIAEKTINGTTDSG